MQANSISLVYQPGQAPRDITLANVSDFVGDPNNFIWLELQSPVDGMLTTLGEELGLHELSLEDALTTHQRPKLDEYGDYLFISSKVASLMPGKTALGELHLFIGANFIVIIRHGPCIDFARARERLTHRKNGFRAERSAALYFILDEIVDQYQPLIGMMSERFHALEAHLLGGGLARQDMEKLYTIKHELNALRDVIDPLQGVVLDLIRVHPDIVSRELKVYYRDVHDHALRALSTIDMLRGAAFDAMQFHMATLTLRQNEAVQKLAGWGAILAIPTVIFSLYGMNFKFMPELNWAWAYPTVVLATLAGGFWLYRRFKKRGWI